MAAIEFLGNVSPKARRLGERADWITADHPLGYGYGEGSPLAKLVAVRGKVLTIGTPFDTMVLPHHAEHLTHVLGKRIRCCEVLFATASGTQWRMMKEFETSLSIVPGPSGDCFAAVVEEILASGRGVQGLVGAAPTAMFDAAAIIAFTADWLEGRFG